VHVAVRGTLSITLTCPKRLPASSVAISCWLPLDSMLRRPVQKG
jgi:hypothetical protein